MEVGQQVEEQSLLIEATLRPEAAERFADSSQVHIFGLSPARWELQYLLYDLIPHFSPSDATVLVANQVGFWAFCRNGLFALVTCFED